MERVNVLDGVINGAENLLDRPFNFQLLNPSFRYDSSNHVISISQLRNFCVDPRRGEYNLNSILSRSTDCRG